MGNQESRKRSQSALGLGASYARQKDISFLYVIGRVLNSGKCGTVRLGHLKGDPSMYVAIKTIDKTGSENTLERLRREINNLMAADHPHIIKLYDVYEDSQYVHLVTEYCSGGELFDRIHTKGRFDEMEAMHVMKMIFEAVHYLHKRRIVHRDLKPENFMYLSSEESSPLKMIDFGFSKKLDFNENAPLTLLGTPSFLAPEVLTGNYGTESDLWSCGVILYTLLAGRYPFYDQDERKIIQQVKRGEFSLTGVVWLQVSSEAKNLITALLDKNPQTRLTAQQALEHPWLTKTQGPVITLEPSLVEAFRSFQISTSIQRQSMLFVVNHCNLREIRALHVAFQEQDEGNTGLVYPEELRRLIRCRTPEEFHADLDSIFINPQGAFEGKINYMNFFSAAKGCKLQLLEQTLWETFKSYCPSEDGYISVEQAGQAIQALGIVNSQEELRRGLGTEEDQLTFEAFKLLLRKIS